MSPSVLIDADLSLCWRDTIPLFHMNWIIFLLTWHSPFTPEVLNFLLADAWPCPFTPEVLNYLIADVTLSLYSWSTELSSCWRDTVPLLLRYWIILLLTWPCPFNPEVLNYLIADVTLYLYSTCIVDCSPWFHWRGPFSIPTCPYFMITLTFSWHCPFNPPVFLIILLGVPGVGLPHLLPGVLLHLLTLPDSNNNGLTNLNYFSSSSLSSGLFPYCTGFPGFSNISYTVFFYMVIFYTVPFYTVDFN